MARQDRDDLELDSELLEDAALESDPSELEERSLEETGFDEVGLDGEAEAEWGEGGDAEHESPLFEAGALELEGEAPQGSPRLGTLAFTPPGGAPFRYAFTADDLLWTARFLNGEAGGRDDPENRAILWTMFNRYAFFRPVVKSWGRFGNFIRRYSTPLQPYLYSAGAARRHHKSPDWVSMPQHGTYPGTQIARGQLGRFLKLQQRPWTSLSAASRQLATRAMQGAIPNQIGAASEFGNTAVYFKDKHGKAPTRAQWEQFTRDYARSKGWRWLEQAPYDQYRRNVLFVNGKALRYPAGARVLSAGAAARVATLEARRPGPPLPAAGGRPPAGPAAPAASGTGGPVMSSLAVVSPRGFNPRGSQRETKVYGLIVHTTGSSPAEMAAGKRKRVASCTSAADCALALYATGKGFAHYLIGYDGKIFATAPENKVAWHAGWGPVGGKAHWQGWTAPEWWKRVWGAGKTPVDLLPPGVSDPNSRSIGVELLGNMTDRTFTDAQYRSLARLVVDVDRRYGLGIDRAPSKRLLGHEDVNPELDTKKGRANRFGGWDPGAHSVRPKFSWERLWREVQGVRGSASAREIA
jgi:N-acetyl-anhydromuramyl-L-alanine amidase AmpD